MTSLFCLKDLNGRWSLPPANSPDPVVRNRFLDNWHWWVLFRNGIRIEYLHSNNSDAKLMHIFPSQVPFPRLFTVPGIDAVSISSTLLRMPSGVRNPTMIFGTPRRNDCIQNFISFRSKVIISRSLRISALVLSSTQLIELPSDGLESHTKDN
jgi:hypothetical protein